MSVTLKAAAADDAVFPKPICLSFSGCGFLGLYHVGVAICINEHRHLLRIEKVGGASAGALTGAHLLCGGDFGEVILELFEVATKARSGWLGPFSPNFNIVEHVRDGLRRFLPADAHKICSGRLFISMTRVSDAVNVVVSHYTSREDLIQALICSSFVPVFSGIVPPLFRGRRYWDGGITDNLPKFDSETVTISPFSGVSSICPEDVPQAFVNLNVVNTSFKWSTSNFNRLSRALFPPNPESLRQLVREGYRDALKFVQKITAYIPDEPTPLNEQEQEYFRLKQARQIKRENAAQRNMDKKSTGLENVPASRIQKASAVPPQPQPMETLPSETRSAAAARQHASSDMDTESGVASSTEDDLTAPPLPPHLPSIHVSNLTDAEKILNAATVLAEHGETNITKLRDAGPYELSVLSRRPSLRSLGMIDHHAAAAADDDELKSHARISMQNVAAQKRNITRTYSADDVRLMMSSIRRASPGDVDEDDATSDDDDEREHDRVRRPHRYVQEMPNYLSNALQEACIRDFIAENPYQSNFTILPIPWTLPLELTYSIILSMIEAIPNRSARWWQSASERSYAKRCLLMLRHTLGLVVGQLVRSQDRAAGTIPAVAAGVVTSGALVDAQTHHEDETQRRERFLDHVFSHLRHHAPAPVAFVVNKSVGVAHRAVSRSTRVGRKAASYAFGLDRYNTDDDYDYDSDDEYTTCGTDSEAHYTVLSKKRPNAAAAAALNTTITSVSDDEAYAKRREQDVHALLNLNESHAVAALLGASEVYSSPPPPTSTSRKSSAANDDQWFDYDTAYDRDFSRPHFCAGNTSSSATMLPPPTIVEEDEAESISGFVTPYSPRPPRSSSSRMAVLSTPVSPSMQRKATGGAKSSPASPRKISYADGLSASSSAEAAATTAAAAAAQLQAAFQKGQHLSSTIRSLNVAGIDDFYGSTSFIRAHPGVPAPAPASNNKRPRSPASADSLEPKRHWVVTPGSTLLTSAPAVDRHESTAPSSASVAARDETDFARSLSGRTRRMHDAEQARRKTKADTDVDADDEQDVDDSTNDERSVTRLAAAAASRSEAADDTGGSKNNHERGKVRSSLASLNKTFSSFVSSLYKTTRASHSSD